MSCVVELLRSRFWPRAAALALTTVGLAACSADSSRFNDNPFASTSNPDATGSIRPHRPRQSAASRRRPLPLAYRTRRRRASGDGRGMRPRCARLAGPRRAPDRSHAPRPAPSGNWSWDGGTAITVGPGDTIDSIARRYGVPAVHIMQANNITAPATIHPGQRLVIPRYSQPALRLRHRPPPRRVARRRPRPPPQPRRQSGRACGRAGRDPEQDFAALPQAGQRARQGEQHPGHAPSMSATAWLFRACADGGSRGKVGPAPPSSRSKACSLGAEGRPSQCARERRALFDAGRRTATGGQRRVEDRRKATGALPKFRWPANGRVIAGFGPKTNGQQNDGINIAVPENTPVKAAEDGVVAYAGNELKGYGNLVLVRHPNGYVTAYAHAKELLVKRGDQVKRGQIIARSGQTGNVNAPQLHFEIRKGASPVDPTQVPQRRVTEAGDSDGRADV